MVILLAQVGFGAFKTSVRFTSFTQTVIVPQKQPSHGPKTFCASNLTLRIAISALVLRNRARDDNSRCYLQRTCLSPVDQIRVRFSIHNVTTSSRTSGKGLIRILMPRTRPSRCFGVIGSVFQISGWSLGRLFKVRNHSLRIMGK